VRTQPLLPRTSAAAALGAALLLAVSCAAIDQRPGVMFSSRPSGARVLVDGVDSGFVTPCYLDLVRVEHSVDLVLDGYIPTRVAIDPRGETWLIHYNEAWLDYNTWRFPLWLNFWDAVTPIKIERGYSPERVFVAMKLVEKGDRPRRGSGR
jgi:hypothetical protein